MVLTEESSEVELAGAGVRVGRARPAGSDLLLALALLSFATAALHFAFAPGHFDASRVHGLFFVVAGWLQLIWAVAVIVRPSRRLFVLGLLNAVVVVVWIASRTTGVPFGPGLGNPEPVGFPDALATGFEALIVVGSLVLVTGRHALPASVPLKATASALAAGVLVMGATGVALTPHFAGEHHGHGGVAAAGHVHTTAGLTGATPCERSGPPASPAQVTDVEGHFHRGPVPQVALGAAAHATLAQEQLAARGVALRIPTVADAERAGYVMSTPFVPCIGAHYTNIGLVGRFDPSAPSELLFDGTTPTSHIVGLSYLVHHPGGAPTGFAGPNDRWHQHNANGGLCFAPSGFVIGAETMTPAQCAAIGGHKAPLVDVWMLHDWVVPGMECGWGVFAPECPELGGRIGGSAWDAPARS